MKLTGVKEYTGKIILRSGLHIGAGDAEMHIGGTDNPVIKHPHTLEPYIPGSSLKGKIRFLLELRSGLIGKRKKVDGSPLSLKDFRDAQGEERAACAAILKLFGISGADQDDAGEIGPSRASFADCALEPEWRKNAFENNRVLTEVKSENSIDRIKGTALNPRFTERVPADTHFSFSITVKQMEGDEDLENILFQGLKLLELDTLGGSGSRGYGRVVFLFNESEDQNRYESTTPF
ncbi:MAG: type III-A CRISPR-associated RAMP protein Csm3 [Deltaproteobacteria bacterium]|nr:MAG: type III-A CRISPR-associated RAMP protein Csm3 [Deltaproteobacteria bacterium]